MVVGPRRFVSLATEKEWILKVRLDHEKGTNFRWGIIIDEALVGMVYLDQVDLTYRSAVLGIMIGNKSFWGIGVAKETYMEVLKYAFNELGLNSIRSKVVATNVNSIKLHTSIGFKVEGTLREAVYRNGEYLDVISLGLLKKEFSVKI